MDIKDCRVGMEVMKTRIGENFIISKVQPEGYMKAGEGIVLNNGEWCFAKEVEPVNRFRIGEPVIDEVQGKKMYYCGEKRNGKVILEYECGNILVTDPKIVSKPKIKDELEKGDKFARMGTKYEVLSATYEDFRDSVIYFAKMLNGNLEGRIVNFDSKFIDKIIYE